MGEEREEVFVLTHVEEVNMNRLYQTNSENPS
jgi:hypothetical protein